VVDVRDVRATVELKLVPRDCYEAAGGFFG
jgi:hypothetical protein